MAPHYHVLQPSPPRIFRLSYHPEKVKVEGSHFSSRFFSKVSPSNYLGRTEGLAGNSKPTYKVCDSKSEKSAPMYCFKGTPLRYSLFAWIVGLTNLAQ